MNKDILSIAGVFLVFEGLFSILLSQDQQPVSTIGRFVRMGIGAGLVICS